MTTDQLPFPAIQRSCRARWRHALPRGAVDTLERWRAAGRTARARAVTATSSGQPLVREPGGITGIAVSAEALSAAKRRKLRCQTSARNLLEECMPSYRCFPGFTTGFAGAVAIVITALSAPLNGVFARESGDPIQLQWMEGDVAGMTAIWSPDATKVIGFIEYHQHRQGDH